MPRFSFRGDLVRRGVTFYVDADTEAQACEKASKGQFAEYDDLGAETADWALWTETCEKEEE